MLRTSTAATATDKKSAATFSEYVVDRLRLDIVSGALAPRACLAMKELCERYAVGLSPIREALHRLAGEGIVQTIGQRGFRVPTLSMEDIEDLTALRGLIEEAAVRQALLQGDVAWESRLRDAFARYELQLDRMDGFADLSDAAIAEYDRIHRAFHVSFFTGVVSPRIAALHASLFDQAYRYRKTLHRAPQSPARALSVHRDLMERMLSRDVEAAVAATHAHLRTTLDATARYLAPDGAMTAKRSGPSPASD